MEQVYKIKIGFCVAYDWYLLKWAIPPIYKQADIICLSIDQHCKSWTGNTFDIDLAALEAWVKTIDTEHKIQFYRDDFSIASLSPMENEVRQRNKMAQYLGIDQKSWYIQLDADEYFLNFEAFCNELQQLRPTRPINVCCPFVILFKKTDKGYLFIKNEGYDQQELIPIATNVPAYQFGRRNGYFNYHTRHIVLHQSWARSAEEIQQKLQNWGHHKDFDLEKYFAFWNSLSERNYQQIQNFHPFHPNAWERLELLPYHSIDELLSAHHYFDYIHLSAFQKFIKNSIWVSRFKSLFKR